MKTVIFESWPQSQKMSACHFSEVINDKYDYVCHNPKGCKCLGATTKNYLIVGDDHKWYATAMDVANQDELQTAIDHLMETIPKDDKGQPACRLFAYPFTDGVLNFPLIPANDQIDKEPPY